MQRWAGDTMRNDMLAEIEHGSMHASTRAGLLSWAEQRRALHAGVHQHAQVLPLWMHALTRIPMSSTNLQLSR